MIEIHQSFTWCPLIRHYILTKCHWMFHDYHLEHSLKPLVWWKVHQLSTRMCPLSPKYQQHATIYVLESTYDNLLEHTLTPLIWQKVPLQKIMYYITIQFVTTCNYSSFAAMFYNHLFNFVINFVTMLWLLNHTSFHID